MPAAVGLRWRDSHGVGSLMMCRRSCRPLVTLSITLYYALVTVLERKVNPAFGWLLGVPVPMYEESEKEAA